MIYQMIAKYNPWLVHPFLLLVERVIVNIFYLHLFFLARPPVPILTFGVTLSSEVTDLIYYVPESLKCSSKSHQHTTVSLCQCPSKTLTPEMDS